jgi:hypothetical protein
MGTRLSVIVLAFTLGATPSDSALFAISGYNQEISTFSDFNGNGFSLNKLPIPESTHLEPVVSTESSFQVANRTESYEELIAEAPLPNQGDSAPPAVSPSVVSQGLVTGLIAEAPLPNQGDSAPPAIKNGEDVQPSSRGLIAEAPLPNQGDSAPPALIAFPFSHSRLPADFPQQRA